MPSAKLLVLLFSIGLGGCAAPGLRTVSDPWPAFEAAGFRAGVWSAQGLSFRGALRELTGTGPLRIYIEGDGKAWLTRNRPSPDPTPREAIAAGLAQQDGYPAVLYLARPCQWLKPATGATCDPANWTQARYSKTVVAAYREVIAAEQRRRKDPSVLLIGHSGGGVLAALLARRLENVVGLITLAANLDTQAWTEHHRVSALTGSLNPAEDAALGEPPFQRHYAGGRDTIVPPAIVQAYARRIGREDSVRILPKADHHCCWLADWPELLRDLPALTR